MIEVWASWTTWGLPLAPLKVVTRRPCLVQVPARAANPLPWAPDGNCAETADTLTTDGQPSWLNERAESNIFPTGRTRRGRLAGGVGDADDLGRPGVRP